MCAKSGPFFKQGLTFIPGSQKRVAIDKLLIHTSFLYALFIWMISCMASCDVLSVRDDIRDVAC